MKTKQKVMRKVFALAVALCLAVTVPVNADAASKKTSAKAVKSVTLKVSKKKVNKKTVTVTKGSKPKVTVTVNPSKAKKSVTYKTSNKKVATISKKGVITAKKNGTVKITIKVKGKNKKTKAVWFKVKVVTKTSSTASSSSSGTTSGHTHTWKAHYATKTVDDYAVTPTVWKCDCGATLPSAPKGDPMYDTYMYMRTQHQMEHALNGQSTGGYATTGEKVKVGSHTEQYVDYYYCDCGAKK